MEKRTDMISRSLIDMEAKHGIKSIRFDAAGPIVQVNSSECKVLNLDHETGGVWYQLDPSKMAIPMEQGMVYIYPAAMRGIQFNE